MTSDTGARPSNGLSIVWDVVVAPKGAFAALRERPYIGWAFLITAVLGMVGQFLQIPAGQHIAVATFSTNATHDPRIAAMSPADLQKMVAITKTVQQWVWLFFPIILAIGLLCAAVLLLVFAKIGRGDGTFRSSLALAANVGILTFGVNPLLIGALTVFRGGDAFTTTQDLLLVVPSLAWLAPGAPAKLVTLLASLNIISIWSFVLLALGQQIVSRVSPLWSWIGAAVIVLGSAVIAAAAVK